MKKFKNDLEIAKFLLKLEKRAYCAVKKQKIKVKDKAAHDLVTNYDTFVEKFLLRSLHEAFGDVKIVSEEFNPTVDPAGECFVIDPIDGTINFANGLEAWGIQMAYVRDNRPIASAILMPFYGEFFAAEHFGAFKNGEKFVCKKRDLLHSLVCLDNHDAEIFSKCWLTLAPHVLQQRFCGAACLNLTMAAEGKLGVLTMKENAHPWDLLPGHLIAQEAGCTHKIFAKHHVWATTQENLDAVEKILKDVKL